MSFGIICYPKPTVFLKLRSSKVIRFSEKIMFVGKYPRIILRQTEVSVYIYELPRKKIYCCENCDQCTFPSATDGCRPFSHPGACMPNIFSFGGTTLLLFRRHMQCHPKRRYSSCQRCPELCSLHTLVCNMAKKELKNVCACPRLTCQSITTMYIY